MKNIKKILLILGIVLLSIMFVETVGAVDFSGIGTTPTISGGSSSLSSTVTQVGFRFLTIVKYLFSGVLLIILVYTGIRMIVSMGTDEDSLSKSKRTIRYSLIGLFFINMPGTIYTALKGDRTTTAGGISSSWNGDTSGTTYTNLFFNNYIFGDVINDTIIKFLEIGLAAISVVIIMLAGFKILTSRGKSEDITQAKNKILWSIIGLVSIGFIEAWKRFIYNGNISDGSDIFKTVANLVLFLAAPTAIFFLSLAGYYYITSAGNEENIKKAKSIIINVVLAIVILLMSYIFLSDLATLMPTGGETIVSP